MEYVENGTRYKIEDGQVVEAALLKTAYYGDCPNPECDRNGETKYDLDKDANCESCGTSMNIQFGGKKEKESFAIGDRVEVDERLGRVEQVSDSLYGEAATVRFDDGSVEGYLTEQLTRSTARLAGAENPADELLAEYEEYEQMPGLTAAEMQAKLDKGHQLAARARMLISRKETPLATMVALDELITATTTDALDLREAQQLMHGAESVVRSSRFEIGTNNDSRAIMGHSGGGDASWLSLLVDDVPEQSEGDKQEHLAKVAASFVDRFSSAQLRDEQFVSRAVEMQRAYEPMLRDGSNLETFRSLLDRAREDRFDREAAKTASAEKPEPIDLENFDTSALFLGG